MNILGYEISKKKESKRHTPQNAQIRSSEVYSGFGSYSAQNDVKTFKIMRDLVSFLDASVLKRTLLLGDFNIYGEDDTTTEFLNNYKKRVKENFFGRGFTPFLHQHADSVYATGIGISERVMRDDLGGASQLMNSDPENLRFIPDAENGYILGYQTSGMFQPKPFENQELVYYTAFDKRYGSPKGYSLFHSLEFATQLQTRLMQALHNQVWRIGDPVFVAVTKGETVESGEYGIDAENVSNSFKSQLGSISKARSRGQVGDAHLYMPGDYEFEVKALGVDGMPVFDFTANSRVVIEQLITKTHLPPYAFGFYQWNSNYKMSTDQQKLLISAVNSDRMSLNEIIERDFGMELFANGMRKKFHFEWKDVDLTELVDSARANKANAEANEKNVNTQINSLWMNGIIDDNQLMDALEFYGAIPENANKQKILDNLGNIRKMALLKNVSQSVLNDKTKTAFDV